MAEAANREVWGFPAATANVELAVGRLTFAVQADAADGRMLRIAGPLGPGVPYPRRDIVQYSRLGRSLLRSTIDLNGRVWAHPAPPVHLRLGPSDARLARCLRELGIDGARPTMCLPIRGLQARLTAPAPLTPLS
jgi:hypothetical protein